MQRRADRLVGLFLLGWVLLTPPLLMLPTGAMIGGIPAPYVYINAVWLSLVVLIVRYRLQNRAPQLVEVEVEVPPIAEGYGAPTLADATLSRTFLRAGRKVGFVNARCRGGRLQLRGQLLFANGDRLPATLTSPCHTPG